MGLEVQAKEFIPAESGKWRASGGSELGSDL